MSRFLLLQPSYAETYADTLLKGVVPAAPALGLACLAGSLLEKKHITEIFDLNIHTEPELSKKIKTFNPDYVCITFTTPYLKTADKISKFCKKLDAKIITIGGGPHASALPQATLRETSLDIVVIGEGDLIIQDIASGKKWSQILGIAYRQKGKVHLNKRRPLLKELDRLPMPAYQLFEINKYCLPHSLARKNPVAWVETSRGCFGKCIYCNKSCFGSTFRTKSPERVCAEFQYLKNLGFQELHIADDGFTTDISRAKAICNLLIKNKVNISWSPFNGIRADRVDQELLKLMKQAGCYRVYYGIESGDQDVLDRIKKGITLDQITKAVQQAKKAGLEVFGLFMIGLPGETETSMQKTIDFAKTLRLDYVKMTKAIPLPNTEFYQELLQKNLIKSFIWQKYQYHYNPREIYDHQTLSWKVIEKYYNKFYKTIYFNPFFLIKRFFYSIWQRTIFQDILFALKLIMKK